MFIPPVISDVGFDYPMGTGLGQTLATLMVAGKLPLFSSESSREVTNSTRYVIEQSSSYIKI